MAYEKKLGDIAIFKNDRKERDTHPDYTITGLGLDGLPIKGALWLKDDRNGKKFMAGRIEVDQYLIDKNPDSFPSANSGGVSGGGSSDDYSAGFFSGGVASDSDIPF